MGGWTDVGKKAAFLALHTKTYGGNGIYQYIVLLKGSSPTVNTVKMSDVTEVATGNGYDAGGGVSGRLDFSYGEGNAFTICTVQDTPDRAYIKIRDIQFTCINGVLPSDGSGALYAVLTDDNDTIADREIYYYWDLTGPHVVSSGNSITITGLEMQLNEV